MDPIVPKLEEETRRRRRRRLFSHNQVPVRMLVPNFFTLLGLCAGLTSIRMSIEGRYELALALVVFAALLDGVDGRVARLLKASSRFGAELDSLADFVNFGVAPAFLIFTWGLGDLKSVGWICVLLFALASAMRLARFNVAIDGDRPKWQSNYFIGMPTPAAAIAVLLPVYLHNLEVASFRYPSPLIYAVLVYTLVIAALMVSTIPTFSGKLLGERISREWVMPLFVLAVAVVANLLTYPSATLAVLTLIYLALIPVSFRRYSQKEREGAPEPASETAPQTEPTAQSSLGRPATTDGGRVVDLRAGDQKR